MTDADPHGHLYERVLEHARREIEEASGKMDELHRSMRLLEARVEAAKSVYEAVAARLNVENEAEDAALGDLPYPDPPAQAPEPPRAEVSPQASAPAEADMSLEAPPPRADPPEAAQTEQAQAPSADIVDMDLIRQHLSRKLEQAPEPEPARLAPEPAETEEDEEGSSFSVDLIRRHLDGRAAREQSPQPERVAPEPAPVAPVAKGSPVAKGAESSGLSDADRELIGAYLRSKQGN